MGRGRASPFGKESMGERTSNVPDHIRDEEIRKRYAALLGVDLER